MVKKEKAISIIKNEIIKFIAQNNIIVDDIVLKEDLGVLGLETVNGEIIIKYCRRK